MAFLGADTDELQEAAQKCQQGAQTADEVIAFLKALILALRAASFFTGGASAAYATYLETVVVPWLQKISMALKLFAKVLGANADAQNQASAGESVDFGSLPTYQTPSLPSTDTSNYPSILNPTNSAANSATSVQVPSTSGTASPHVTTTVGPDGTTTVTVAPAGAAPQGVPTSAPAPSASHAADVPIAGSNGLAPGSMGGANPDGRPALGTSIGTGHHALGGDLARTDSGSSGGTSGSPIGSAGGALGGGSAGGGATDAASHPGTAVHSGGLPGGSPAVSPATTHSGDYQAGDGTAAAAGHPLATDGGTSSKAVPMAAAGLGAAGALGLGGAALGAKGGALTGSPAGTQTGTGTGFTSPAGYDYNKITGASKSRFVTPEFLRKVEEVSARLGTKPEYLMGVMSAETNGTFNPGIKNPLPHSTATGLIQFTEDTARGLHTSTAALKQMTPVQQLDYVERYLEPRKGQLGTVEGLYTTVLGGPGKTNENPDAMLIPTSSKAYHGNAHLDHDGNGVSVKEAADSIRARIGR